MDGDILVVRSPGPGSSNPGGGGGGGGAAETGQNAVYVPPWQLLVHHWW